MDGASEWLTGAASGELGTRGHRWSALTRHLPTQGWSIELQEKLEEAEIAIEVGCGPSASRSAPASPSLPLAPTQKAEFEEIRKNATLDFFAQDEDY